MHVRTTVARLRGLPMTKIVAGLGTVLLAAAPAVTATVAADAPAAVASIKPIHSLLAGVMEGAGRPTLLVRGYASPHTWSLRPSEAHTLQEADLVVWVGEDLESFLARPLRSLADDAYVLELSRAEGITLLPVREGGVWDGHAHHGEHGEGEDEDAHHGEHGEGEGEDAHHDEHDEGKHEDAHHDEHDEGKHEDAHHDEHGEGKHEDAHVHHEDGHEHGRGEFDAHVWLDPANAEVIASAMAQALSQVDPGRAALYRANAEKVRARLRALDAELQETLAPVTDRGFIVFHDAWSYFDTRYDLRAVGSVTVSPDQPPGAARLAEIRERLRDAKAECVFAEPQFEPGLVRTLVAGTGAAVGVLDPLGAAIEDGPDLYFTLMRANAAALRDCFGR